MWRLPTDARDPEQYAALDSPDVRADPVLRLALRDPALEGSAGVTLPDGVRVHLDARERTVMQEARDGATQARTATREVMEAAADLHARHHFTAACACDGSLMEESLPSGGCRRRVSYGVWEGARGGKSAG